jgi:hypothetical protein
MIDLNKNIFFSIKSYSVNINKNNGNKVLFNNLNKLIKRTWFRSLFPSFCSFYSSANKKHPDFLDVLESLFTNKFISKCMDIDKTYNYIKQNNMQIHDAFLNGVKKFFTEEEIKKINYYDNPEENRIATRFLDINKKWNTRKLKREQIILKEVNSKIKLDSVKDINSICHDSKVLNKFVDDLNLKKKSMLEINCMQLASEIDEYINRIKENINLSKYGFYRVSISKLLELASSMFKYRSAEIIPIKDKDYLKQYDIPDFLKLCDNFFGKNLSIFDHYAKIKFIDGPMSFLIGEIDSKSYFVGLIYE